VPFDAERAQQLSDRAAFIIEATRAGELLPRAYDAPQDWRWSPTKRYYAKSPASCVCCRRLMTASGSLRLTRWSAH
jgi:hypothetical protein